MSCSLGKLCSDVLMGGAGINPCLEELVLINLDDTRNNRLIITTDDLEEPSEISEDSSQNSTFLSEKMEKALDRLMGFRRKQEKCFLNTLYIRKFEFKKKKIPNLEILSNVVASEVHKSFNRLSIKSENKSRAGFVSRDFQSGGKNEDFSKEKDMLLSEDTYHWLVRMECAQENRNSIQIYSICEVINTPNKKISIFLKFSTRPIPEFKDEKEYDCPKSCVKHFIDLTPKEEETTYLCTLYDLICCCLEHMIRNPNYDFWSNNCQTIIKKLFYRNGFLEKRILNMDADEGGENIIDQIFRVRAESTLNCDMDIT